MIDLQDVRQAADRIRAHVRRTPLLKVDQLIEPLGLPELWLKLESLQVTGSFKARGAMSKLLSTPREALRAGIVTASGGNHGVAVARAGRLAGVPTTVFLPRNASPLKRTKLERCGAEVRIAGNLWDESNRAAQSFSAETGAVYFHPFADSQTIAGQGTCALEILEELPDADLYLIAIGGGGLIAGMATVIRTLQPGASIIGVEPVGSPTLRASLDAGTVVTLPSVTTVVPTMACGRTDPGVFEVVRRLVDDIVLVEDRDMVDAAHWLWLEFGIAADLSGAAGLAALRNGRIPMRIGQKVCALVCGAGVEGFQTAVDANPIAA